MPKDTFFNLSEEKQKKLIGAIKNELSRVPFQQFSINKIVKEADIARGSFYQYFADRDDMIEFIMFRVREEMEARLIERLKQNDGDLFDLFEFLFKSCMEMTKNKEHGALYRNVLSDIKINAQFFMRITDYGKKRQDSNALLQYVNREKLNIKSDEELSDLFYMLKAMSIASIAEAFIYTDLQEQIIQDYKRRLMLIKTHFERKK